MKKICFLQYSLNGGGAERKICTLANYFVSQGYEVEIGLFGRNIVKYDLDSRVRLTFIRRNTYVYKSKFEKLKYIIHCCFENVLIRSALISENTIGRFVPIIKDKITGERVVKHYQKRDDYIKPLQSYIMQRQDRVFITMMVQSYLEVIRRMQKEIKRGRFTAPYIVMECNNPLPGADVTAELAKQRDIWYPWAAKCVSMTQACVECFSKEIQDKSVVIPNPIRDDLPEPYNGIRRKTIVTYCRLYKQKNLPLLINAFAQFHKKYFDYNLEIYGEGEQKEELEKLIKDNGLSDAASIMPFDPHIHEKIKNCAMFVSSSDWEGFGNSILESLAIGLPVIATDCKFGPREMVHDHENGLLIPVGDVNALCQAMIEIVENPEQAEKFSFNAVKVREKYSAEQIGRQWLELIESV